MSASVSARVKPTALLLIDGSAKFQYMLAAFSFAMQEETGCTMPFQASFFHSW